MTLSASTLRERHPRLLPETANNLALKIAVALDRHHASPIALRAEMFGERLEWEISWQPRTEDAQSMLDQKVVTQLGAEGLALLLMNEMMGWVVVRKLQEGEHADWLLRGKHDEFIGLEVAGTDHGDPRARLRRKLADVAEFELPGIRVACVVHFQGPEVIAREQHDE